MKYLFLLLAFGLMLGCSSTRQVVDTSPENRASAPDKTGASGEVQTREANIDLATYLRRIPGVTVDGSGQDARVRVRMGGSPLNDQEPLFVVDGDRITSYATVLQSVDTNDIKSVRVLKDVSETSSYGFQGQNGVIIIRLKKVR